LLELTKYVEGGIGIEIGYILNAHPPFEGGYNTSIAVIVPGMTIGSGGNPPPIPPVIQAMQVSSKYSKFSTGSLTTSVKL